MADDNRSTDEQLLVALDEQLAKLTGGDASIGDFSKWFMSLEREAVMAARSSGLRLRWSIENLLYQWRSYPDHVDAAWVLQGIHDLIAEEPSLRLFFQPKVSILGNDLQRVSGNRFEGLSAPVTSGRSYALVA
jgi:hypothetical protein